MAELTTAQTLGAFWEELVEEGFEPEWIDGVVAIAARQIIADEGLIVGEYEDDDDPDEEEAEVGTVSLRVVPDFTDWSKHFESAGPFVRAL